MSDLGTNLVWVLAITAVVIVSLLGFVGMFKAFYIKVPQGTALIVNDMSSTPIALATFSTSCGVSFTRR